MSIAFVLGGLVVAGVFAFVYFQKKKKEQDQNNNNANGSSSLVAPTSVDDNSTSGTSGYVPTENAPAEEHNTAPANEPAVESIPNRDEEVQQSR
jgi:LPXTG-motif cell wall-anchored protein